MLNAAEERQETKDLINKFDRDAQERILHIKDINELIIEKAKMRGLLGDLNNEYNLKENAVKAVLREIEAQALTLSRQKIAFEKENTLQIKELNTKLAQVNDADKRYNTLIQEADVMKSELRGELFRIEQERKHFNDEMARMTLHVEQTKNEATRAQADVAGREAELEEAKTEFEAEKEAIQPELRRISEIKNENENLYTKIESDRLSFDATLKQFDAHKQNQNNDVEVIKSALKLKEQSVEDERLKLIRMEEDLNDQRLQLKAEAVEVEKMRKRYQFNKAIEDSKKEEVKPEVKTT